MNEDYDRDDPVGALVDGDAALTLPAAEVVPEMGPDAQPTGYYAFVPTEHERKRIERHLTEELDIGIADYESVWQRAAANIRVYEATPERDELIMIPIAKRDANQVIAKLVAKICNRNPIATVEPEELGDLEVPIPGPIDPVSGQRISRMEWHPAEEIANGVETLFQRYLTKKIPFRQAVTEMATDAVQGATPTWLKTYYEPQTRIRRSPAFEPFGARGAVVATGMKERRVSAGSPYQMRSVSVFNVVMPSEAMDPQEAEWIAEKNFMTSTALRQAYDAGQLNMLDDDTLKDLLKNTSDLTDQTHRKDLRDIEGKKITSPTGKHEVWLVWFYWPHMELDEVTGEWNFSVVSLCGNFHRGANKLMSCHVNAYEDRPYESFFQRKRPHSHSGGSLVEDAAPYQKLISTLFHLQTNNAVQANTVAFQVRSGSKAWAWFQAGNKVRPGSKIPFDVPGEVMPFNVGTNYRSLSPEIGYLDAGVAKSTVVNDYDRGDIPSRTAASTVNLIQESASAQPAMVIDSMREGLSRVLTRIGSMMSYWSMYGETIPVRDAESQALVAQAIRFPADGLTGNFAITITASSEEDTDQAQFEKTMALLKTKSEADLHSATLLGPLLSPQAPPAVKAIHRKMFLAQQRLIGRQFEIAKLDKKKYVIDERELDQILAQQEEFLRQQMMQQQQGAMNGGAGSGGVAGPEVQDASARGALQVAAPPEFGGGGGMAPFPGNAAAGGPDPAALALLEAGGVP